MIVHAILDLRRAHDPLGDAIETFIRRGGRRAVHRRVRGDDPELELPADRGAGAGGGRAELVRRSGLPADATSQPRADPDQQGDDGRHDDEAAAIAERPRDSPSSGGGASAAMTKMQIAATAPHHHGRRRYDIPTPIRIGTAITASNNPTSAICAQCHSSPRLRRVQRSANSWRATDPRSRATCGSRSGSSRRAG